MPELPEVETVRRQLAPELVGAVVADAWAFPSHKFDDAPAAVGRTVGAVDRRGKYLLVRLEPDADAPGGSAEGALDLVVHLGMTGRLAVGPPPDGLDHLSHPGHGRPATVPHLRAAWWLDDGRWLTFVDVRRFGRVAVVPRDDHRTLPTLRDLGPEPWDDAFTPEALRGFVNSRRRHVKTLLLSQRPVAGVGNIYADEALWRAGVHPAARRLRVADAERLRDAVREVLAEGVAHGGTTLRDYRDAAGKEGAHQHHLDCYGQAGSPCPRCGTTLRRTVVDARGTTFCPVCQTR